MPKGLDVTQKVGEMVPTSERWAHHFFPSLTAILTPVFCRRQNSIEPRGGALLQTQLRHQVAVQVEGDLHRLVSEHLLDDFRVLANC